MSEAHRHFIECDCSHINAGDPVIINGHSYLTAAHPATWAGLTISEKADWLRDNRNLDLRAYVQAGRRWVELGEVTDLVVLSEVYRVSFDHHYRRERTGPATLVGEPLNVRGVRGFDDICASEVVATYVTSPNSQKRGAVIETRIGVKAQKSFSRDRRTRLLAAVLPRWLAREAP